MNEEAIQQAQQHLIRCCEHQPRYRVAWLVGPPLSGKTQLAQQLSESRGWRYLDYTLTPGHFDALRTRITAYQPDDFVSDIRGWCEQHTTPALVVDRIDSILACWSFDQRRVWVSRIARLTGLPCGLLLCTHILNRSILSPFLPDRDQRYCVTFEE